MTFELFLQLFSVVSVVAIGPAIVLLLFTRQGNL